MPCPGCGAPVSTQGRTCPACGHDLYLERAYSMRNVGCLLILAAAIILPLLAWLISLIPGQITAP